MENYESPLVEIAGGNANHLEPQVNIPVSITDVALLAEVYLTFVLATTPIVAVAPFVAAVFVKTAGPTK